MGTQQILHAGRKLLGMIVEPAMGYLGITIKEFVIAFFKSNSGPGARLEVKFRALCERYQAEKTENSLKLYGKRRILRPLVRDPTFHPRTCHNPNEAVLKSLIF
jgi:hypothetical protein